MVVWKITECAVVIESDEAATYDEWTAAIDEAFASPRFVCGTSVVHDLRRMIRVPTTEEARRRVGFLIARSRAGGVRRWAIVVSGAANYGMARMAQILAEFDSEPSVRLRVFTDLEEAMAWSRRQENPPAASGVA